jgi:cytoskeletal protein CcmA (bactofilin family)
MSVKKHFMSFKLSNDTDTVDTVIGSSVVIDGPVSSKHPIKVDGIIHGSVSTKANLFVGSNSIIHGDIKGKNITICGKVNGNVTAKGRIIITSKAEISGNMSMEQLVVDEGAFFNGNCTMQSAQKPAEEKTDRKVDIKADHKADTKTDIKET